MKIEQRTLDDIRARHELEPELNDVYVEGVFDKEILDQFFSGSSLEARVIYEIDTINIPNELVQQQGFTSGNKQRVLTLAQALQDLPENSAYRCLVDLDLDHWNNRVKNVSRLSITKYTAIETYYLTEPFLKNLLITVGRCKIPDWTIFWTSFTHTLQEIYRLRLTIDKMQLNCAMIAFDKSLRSDKRSVIFDTNGYIEKFLNATSNSKIKESFLENFQAWATQINGDPRLISHGHDFTFLAAWAISAFGGISGFKTQEAVERLLVAMAKEAHEIAKVFED